MAGRVTDDDRQRIIQMRQAEPTLTLREIGERVGHHHETVRRVLTRDAVALSGTGQHMPVQQLLLDSMGELVTAINDLAAKAEANGRSIESNTNDVLRSLLQINERLTEIALKLK